VCVPEARFFPLSHGLIIVHRVKAGVGGGEQIIRAHKRTVYNIRGWLAAADGGKKSERKIIIIIIIKKKPKSSY